MRIRVYPGQSFDQETGFHYNYHRYYDPRTGRYLTPDPIGLAGGINLFAYAWNNPVNSIDPIGLFGLGAAGGGSFTFFGFRGGIDLELRIIKDFNKSIFEGWSLGLTFTHTWANMYKEEYNDSCEEQPSPWGMNVEGGVRSLITNANNIGQMIGESVTIVGAGAGLIVGGGGELSVMTEEDYRTPVTNSPGSPVYELSLGAPPLPGADVGVEAHVKTRNKTLRILTLGEK